MWSLLGRLNSLSMIVLWFIGDVFKLIFYILAQQPLCFIIGNCIQLSTELTIFFQFLAYRKSVGGGKEGSLNETTDCLLNCGTEK